MGPGDVKDGDAVIVVDVQKCFGPTGSLPVTDGDKVVPVLNEYVAAAKRVDAPVVASRDWHPPGHVSFTSEGGPWPPHCLQGSEDAAFQDSLSLPDDALIISKGTRRDFDQYSAFDRTGLAELLRGRGVRRLWIGGLAQDVCVLRTVLDGLREGFKVHVIVDGTRPVNARPGDGERALAEMEGAGAVMERNDG